MMFLKDCGHVCLDPVLNPIHNNFRRTLLDNDTFNRRSGAITAFEGASPTGVNQEIPLKIRYFSLNF